MNDRLIEYMLAPTCHRCGVDIDDPDRPCPESGLGPPLWQSCTPLITEADLHWQICTRCHGDGTLRGWEGAFTESDRAEWSEEDYEDYREWKRHCEDCGGTGKVRVLNGAALERREVQEFINEFYETEAMYAAERRAGA